MKLSELAGKLGLDLHGADCDIDNVADISSAGEGGLAFVYDPRYLDRLKGSSASAFILKDEWRQETDKPVLISADPRLDFARAATILNPPFRHSPGIAPSAIVDDSVRVPDSAAIGANVVIESGVSLGEGVQIGAGSVIGKDVRIGDDTVILANVTIAHSCVIGGRCEINSGVVIGTDGFGYVRDGKSYRKVPQLGRVVIGDDVHIGANTTIDRGALNDTCIHDGVKLDNMIQIGHNVIIGENTVISAQSGVAGSTRIGSNCLIGGSVGIRDNIEVADNTVITGRTFVSSAIRQSGSYSSSVLVDTTANWKKNVMRFKQLDDMAKRLKKLERALAEFIGGNQKP